MKRNVLASVMFAMFVAACGSEQDPMGAPDAAAEPDAEPSGLAYPSGPYGEGADDTIRNLRMIAYIDGDDADDLVVGEEMSAFELAQYYRENDPDAKVIMINSAAGWCGPCQQEAQEIPPLAREYHARGVRFVTAVFENPDYSPATAEFVAQWADTFNLNIPTAVDSTFQLGAYFDVNAMPTNMFVDATNMKILTIVTGYGGPDAFEQILDYYLE